MTGPASPSGHADGPHVAQDRPRGRDALPSLTSLRFFAAAFVVGYHLVRQVGPATRLSYVFWYGRTGVTFFFVLSGTVLAWTYFGRMPSNGVFWWRRFARIWPLHVVATLLSVGLYLLSGTRVSGDELGRGLLLLHAWSPNPVIERGGNGATWSLSDEAFFYLLFPLLLVLLARFVRTARRALLVFWITFACLVGVWFFVGLYVKPAMRSWLVDYYPPVRMLEFVVGVTFGVALARGWRPRLSFAASVVAFLGFHLALLAWGHLTPEGGSFGAYSASQVLAVPVYALAVLAAVRRDIEGRSGWLGAPWLIRLGHWSFAWYLVHDLVIRVALQITGRPSSTMGRLAIWIAVVVTSQAIAGLLYTLVEHPAERYLRSHFPLSRRSASRSEVPVQNVHEIPRRPRPAAAPQAPGDD